jgi:hypothetical protein
VPLPGEMFIQRRERDIGQQRRENPALYYSRSFTKGYGSWPSVADLDRQATT